MLLQYDTPPGTSRLEVLAATWARQTGRSIVIDPAAPAQRSGRGDRRRGAPVARRTRLTR